jgi:hypothetical protein
MCFKIRSYFAALAIVFLPLSVYAENWIEFHQEKWSQKSGKQNKKLTFFNRYYYDAESLAATASGDITLWTKEVSDNDKYYVKKGTPKSETLFRQVHLWCKMKRYEVIQADSGDGGANESMSEEIKSGSYYESLHKAVCKPNSR